MLLPENETDHGHNGCRSAIRQSTGEPRTRFRECLDEPFMKHYRKAARRRSMNIVARPSKS